MSKEESEEAVRNALAKVHEVELLVKDFKEGDNDLLVQRLNAFVSTLGKVRSSLTDCEAEFPIELLRRLDTGLNPEKFVVDAFHTCVVENQKVKGKAINLERFHDALVEQATAAFPEEAEAYKKL